MKQKYYYLFTIIIVIIVLAVLYYYFIGNNQSSMFDLNSNNLDNSNYKWITQGTCASNKMQDLTKTDCSSYLQSSNYNVTGADHGPPGCWLVLGNSLNGVLRDNPQFAGKGFACWSDVQTDGKQCSPDFPCICK